MQAYDLDGKLVHDVKTRHPRLSFITAAAERGGTVLASRARTTTYLVGSTYSIRCPNRARTRTLHRVA